MQDSQQQPKDVTNYEILEFLKEHMVMKEEHADLCEKVDNLEQRFDGYENKFGSLEQRFDRLEQRVARMHHELLEKIDSKGEEIKHHTASLLKNKGIINKQEALDYMRGNV